MNKNPGVSVWSVESGTELSRFEVNPSPIFLDIMLFAGPGELITSKQTNQGKLFQVWDTATGKPLREFKGPASFEADATTVSADGKRMALFSDKQAIVLDLATGKHLAQLNCPTRRSRSFTAADCSSPPTAPNWAACSTTIAKLTC